MTHLTRLLTTILILALTDSAGAEIQPDFAMDSDPRIEAPAATKDFGTRLLPLWRQALARPEQDLQRKAAETIALAHQMGMPGLIETLPRLKAVLLADESLPAVRYAAAKAIIALNARESAPELLDASQRFGADIRQLIEPALAAWDFAPMRAIWLARLTDSTTRHRDLVLAIRGVGRVNEVAALPRLLEVVRDAARTPDVRIEAARAAGLLADQGLEADAAREFDDARPASLTGRICAVRLLARHASQVARQQLLAAAIDTEPVVAAAAMRRLFEIDPELLLPLAESALHNADAHVRQAGVDAFVSRPNPDRMRIVSRLLDDPHPTVRKNVREALFQLAATEGLNESIRDSAVKVLGDDSWRGQQQAALLIGALDHEPAAGRLLELLGAKRPEAFVTAAWALRKLEVEKALPAMLDQANRQTARSQSGEFATGLDEQVGHLLEAFGRMKYAPAEPLLRQYVPKNAMLGERSRSAAIWSLGLIQEGKLDDALASQLIARLTDLSMPPSEYELVRHMSAVTLARMNAVTHAKAIRDYMGPGPNWSRSGIAMRWSVMRLTGEQLVEPGVASSAPRSNSSLCSLRRIPSSSTQARCRFSSAALKARTTPIVELSSSTVP